MNSGNSTSYYLAEINRPNQASLPYIAECGDIIEALGMDFNEGCEFKAIWRTAAARTLGKAKEGHDSRYDAEKRVFYAQRSLALFQPVKIKGVIIRSRDATLEEAQNFMQYFVENVSGFKEFLDQYLEARPPHDMTVGGTD